LRRQLRFRLLQLRLVLVLLNGEKQVALLHPRAVGEVIFFQIPFYSRDKGNRVSRRGIAGKAEVVGDGPSDGFGDGNDRRGRGGTARVFATSDSDAGHSANHEQRGNATPQAQRCDPFFDQRWFPLSQTVSKHSKLRNVILSRRRRI